MIDRLQESLDNPLLNDFIAALEQLTNPEMVFKVCLYMRVLRLLLKIVESLMKKLTLFDVHPRELRNSYVDTDICYGIILKIKNCSSAKQMKHYYYSGLRRSNILGMRVEETSGYSVNIKTWTS